MITITESIRHDFTNVIDTIWVCKSCGAHFDSVEDQEIIHHRSCLKDHEKWEEYYKNANNEEKQILTEK